jgi:uncharacterized damage-inducible protein DinB
LFTLDGIQKFHGWTHASLNLLLDHLSKISPDDYVKELPSFGFSTLQKQVIHIFNCEGFWIHTLQGLLYVDRNRAECPDVAGARLLQQQVSRQTRIYLSGLAVNSSIPIRNFISPMETTPSALLRSSSIMF